MPWLWKLVVEGRSSHRHDETQGLVQFCEFGHKTLFRRFNLTEAINVDKVTANLDRGVLQITAMKSIQEWEKQQHAAAA